MEAVRTFYADSFIPSNPEDMKMTPVDRHVGKNHVIDEFVLEMTHTSE